MSQASNPASVSFRKTRIEDDRDLMAVRDLFASNGFERSVSEVSWIYRQVDGVTPFATMAMLDERLVALYAAVPASFKVGNEVVMATQSLDTMVDKAVRGQGLFTKLANEAYSSMVEQGIGFVYGFPNGNSFHGFTKKLGWVALDPVPFLFRPINLGYIAKKLGVQWGPLFKIRFPVWGGEGRSERLESLPDKQQIDDLWRRFSEHVVVGRVRDYSFLRERYECHPRATYRYRVCRENDEIVGLSIYCTEVKHGGTIGYLMELMCLPGRDDVAKHLIADVLSDMRSLGCDGILAWCFSHSPYYSALLAKMFLPLPTVMRPIELHFGFRGLTGDSAVLADRANWYLSYGDSDTV